MQCSTYGLLLYVWQATQSCLDERPEYENWKKVHRQPRNNWCKFTCCRQIAIGSTPLISCCQPTDMSNIKFSSWKFFSFWKVCYSKLILPVFLKWRNFTMEKNFPETAFVLLFSWIRRSVSWVQINMLLQWDILTLHLFWFAGPGVKRLLFLEGISVCSASLLWFGKKHK